MYIYDYAKRFMYIFDSYFERTYILKYYFFEIIKYLI